MRRPVCYLPLRYDTVDFCQREQSIWSCTFEVLMSMFLSSLPVRMFLNASSTLVESKAEVSMNERVFFSEEQTKEHLWFHVLEKIKNVSLHLVQF